MRKKEDIVRKNIVLNSVFYNVAKDLLEEYCTLHVVTRRKEFDNNYWSLINILQKVLFEKKPEKYDVVKNYSKYGEEIQFQNLYSISGFKKDKLKEIMDFFEQKNFIVPIRNAKGGKNYTGGSEQYTARATIYYIPLQLVLQMQKYEAEHGEAGEWIEIEVSKNNIFYNKEAREQKRKQKEEQMKRDNKPVRIINGVEIYHNQPILPWIEEELNSPYKDFKKWPSDWEQIDIIRISDIDFDEEKFFQIAMQNGIENPVQLLERYRSSAMKTKLSHGRVVRYGWNHLKKCFRDAVVYHGEGVDVGADYHNADFRMLVILAWMKREQYKIQKKQLEAFEADVKYGIYKLMDEWTEYKYGPDRIKQLLLTFKNATNDSKKWFTEFRQSDLEAMKAIKLKLIEHYPTLTKGMLLNYREVTTEDRVKNCLSVHCEHIEGYLMHQFVLPALDKKFVDPFTMCDAVWIRKSLATDENKRYIECVFEEQFDNLVEAVKHNTFTNKEQKNYFKYLIENIK